MLAPCEPTRRPTARELELRLLLGAVHDRYGLDFRDYAHASLKRRVLRHVAEEGAGTIAALRERVLADPSGLDRLKLELTIHVTAMFRDPGFFPRLPARGGRRPAHLPILRLWVAGCSTGEEVYSLAILLHEEGLYPRCRIYATDLSDRALDRARAGIFPLAAMQDYTRNYQRAGGQRAFAEYYTADSESAIFPPLPAGERDLRRPQSRGRRLLQRIPGDLLPQRHDLLQPGFAKPGPPGFFTRASRPTASSGWGAARPCASPPTRIATRR